MAQTYFCMCCGNENSVKVNKCICGAEKGSMCVDIPVKYIKIKEPEIISNSSFGVKLGDKFDFSIFESMAADLEQQIAAHGDEKDLGKWGLKTIEGLDLVESIVNNKS